MIEDNVRRAIEANQGAAIIFAGSASDEPHVRRIVKALQTHTIPYDTRICSAHKQPEKLLQMLGEYEQVSGGRVYVAVAGGTDALSGMLSWHATHPVISCPPDWPNMSVLGNPPGSSNAVIPHPTNLARFVAQMYAGLNGQIAATLALNKSKKVDALSEADTEWSGGEYFRGGDK
ncbi:AIR carboxylase family protein [Candidatus Woesearchaeota archaeon]|nr:AIR carboxylase family protein [Candidatus Woesearchaeota archaeon]